MKIVYLGNGVICAAADQDDDDAANVGAVSLAPSSRVVAVRPTLKNILTPYRPRSSTTSEPHIFVRRKR